MKFCKQCNAKKPCSDFSINKKNGDGLYTYCKVCARKNNIVYGQLYRKSEHGRRVRAKCDKNYSKTSKGKITRRNATKIFREKHPDRYLCHTKVGTGLKNGSVTRPYKCDHCERETTLEAHHSNYSKPLDITWVCKNCHLKLHKRVIA